MAEKKTVVPAPRLKALYQEKYLKELQAELDLKNVHVNKIGRASCRERV